MLFLMISLVTFNWKIIFYNMNLLRCIVFLSVFILFACPVYADVFQYFDEDGTLIVTDNPYGSIRTRLRPPNKYKDIKLDYREDVFYDSYYVSGKNFHEIVDSTKINGPFDAKDNRSYAAQTRWNLGWSYKFDVSYSIEGSYVYVALNILDIKFRSDITVLLPMISEYSSLNHHDLKLWENYLKGLLDHEHDHVKIIKNPMYRDEALKRISEIKELSLYYDNHSDMETFINNAVEAETAKIGHSLIKKIKIANEEYDRRTDHGLKPKRGKFF
jgi:predicted secreted Zn-dependent protease